MECNIMGCDRKVVKKQCYNTKYKKHCYCKIRKQMLFYYALPNRYCD